MSLSLRTSPRGSNSTPQTPAPRHCFVWRLGNITHSRRTHTSTTQLLKHSWDSIFCPFPTSLATLNHPSQHSLCFHPLYLVFFAIPLLRVAPCAASVKTRERLNLIALQLCVYLSIMYASPFVSISSVLFGIECMSHCRIHEALMNELSSCFLPVHSGR